MQLFILCALQDVRGPTPSIVAVLAGYSIHFDGIKLLQCQTFLKAFGAWLAVFHVFSICYPPMLKRSYLFLEKYIVGHTCTVPGPVRRLAEKLLKKDWSIRGTASLMTPETHCCGFYTPWNISWFVATRQFEFTPLSEFAQLDWSLHSFQNFSPSSQCCHQFGKIAPNFGKL